jgi:hypothetical protein
MGSEVSKKNRLVENISTRGPFEISDPCLSPTIAKALWFEF